MRVWENNEANMIGAQEYLGLNGRGSDVCIYFI